MAATEPIPSPPGLPFLGNIGDIDSEQPRESLVHLAEKYGPIYRINLVGRVNTVISSNSLINESMDETRFRKTLKSPLMEIRNGVHDGLFTAQMDEPNWGIAHRVLMPAFGPMSIQYMFDEMLDIAGQMALKWARQGPQVPIPASEDFTRLTLDTLALCAMNYRFNSFYHDELHPFIAAMGDFLKESGARTRRPALASYFLRTAEAKYWHDISILRETANGVLQTRRENPTDRKDLLTAMLDGVDPKTGQKMTDESIVDNLITFLIAGHETTSGLLSFTMYNLLKHPTVYLKAQQEVDQVLGVGPVKPEHMSKLPYLSAILRESLRIASPIPAIGTESLKDQLIGGKYMLAKGDVIVNLICKAHADPAVFGDDANEFVPERMLDENFDRLNREFPNCWKPFGNGARSCIGRPFAWQEALLVLAVLLQNFNFAMDDTKYQLQIKQTLTVKPAHFNIRAVLREGITPTSLEHRLTGSASPSHPNSATAPGIPAAVKTAQPQGKPMNIYYGSNSGTCEALAQRLASDAPSHGFFAAAVEPLDSAFERVPTEQPFVIITASYEGEPPDNAALFVNWLRSLKGNELGKTSYAVFGCGHHDWSQTFHRIPKLVDSALAARGGTQIAPLGLTDSAEGNMFSDFETWEDTVLWPAMAKKYQIEESPENESFQPSLNIEISAPRSSTLRQDVKEARLVAAKELTAPGEPLKKHLEIQLPSDTKYSAGDYLAVLPLNPKPSILRVMRRFQLPWDAHLTISAGGHTTLPTGVSISAWDVLSAYVELAQPATKRGISSLAAAAPDENTKSTLQRLATSDYDALISAKRVSILDLLESYPSIHLQFSTFLSLLPPMRVRQYSISSSPLWNPAHATLTYSVLSAPSISGSGTTHEGVASSYLAQLAPGDSLHVAVRPSHAAFHLPVDSERVPVVMVAAGSGLAPFRGFVQERAALLGAGRNLAPARLYIGCRAPGSDDIYAEELERWAKMGAVDVRRSYSRKPEAAEGCKYVQDRLYADRVELRKMWENEAKVFVCGSRHVGDGVKEAILKIHREWTVENGKDLSEEAALKWFEGIRNERYATDVFD